MSGNCKDGRGSAGEIHMNADRKKRIAHEISNWKNACNCRAVQLTGDRMAALLQEVVDAPEHAGVQEPVAYQVKNGWASVAIYQRQLDAENYAKDQQKRHDLSGSLAHFYVVPIYTAPPAPSVPDVLAATNPSQISSSADLPTWENGDDPLVGGGLISRGVVDFASLGIWYGKPAPDVEPVAYVTGYNNGYPTIAPINSALCMAIGTALYSAPPAPADVAQDAERYRWLTADHASAEARLDVHNIASSIRVRSYAATSAAIDAARERQGGE